MDIKIGKYRLFADPTDRCFNLSIPVKIKTGKNKGKLTDSRTTYHPTIESAFNELLKRKLIESDATEIKILLNELNQYKKEINEFLGMDLDK